MTEILINMILQLLLLSTEVPDGVTGMKSSTKSPDVVCRVDLEKRELTCGWSEEIDPEIINRYIEEVR